MNSTNSESSVPATALDAHSVETKNVAGSTAGAGSGDFHVYRQERRREQDRMASLKSVAENETQIEEDKRRKALAEERTARRAAKRRRKKDLARVRRKRAKDAKAAAKLGDGLCKANGN